MNLAQEMAVMSSYAAEEDDYVNDTFEKGIQIIKKAAMKGNRYVCFYDICHCCNKGYTKDREQMIRTRLRKEGFKIQKAYEIFGGNQITPYVVW